MGSDSQKCPQCGAVVAVAEGRENLHCPQCGSQLLFQTGILIVILCPNCGGKAEYPEDSYSLICPFCKVRHIIAGDARVLRFFVPPKLSREEAIKEASLGAPAERADALGTAGRKNDLPRGAELVFVPYWRCRGMVYYWEMGEARTIVDAPAGESSSGFSLRIEAGLRILAQPENPLGLFARSPSVQEHTWELSSFAKAQETVRNLRTRAFDQSVMSGAFSGAMETLGGRLRIVRQEPYDAEKMAALGRILDPAIAEAPAMMKITNGAYQDLIDYSLLSRMEHGNLVGNRISMVWYPYWVIENKDGHIVVDAALGGMVGPGGPGTAAESPQSVGGIPRLIPARCPHCNNELPVEGFQPLLFCQICQTAWRIDGPQLAPQPVKVVRAQKSVASGNDLKHLPMWRLTVAIESPEDAIRDQAALRKIVPSWDYIRTNADPKKPAFLYVPAWGNHVAPRLSAIARRFTREQPDLAFDGNFDNVLRAVFGPGDAEALALIVLLSVLYVREELPKSILEAGLKILNTELLLLPCKQDSLKEWIEGVFGSAIQNSEVTE